MKRFSLLLSILIVTALSPLSRVDAASLSDTALASIRDNCSNIRLSLQQLQQAEKPIRINRGYLYDTTLKLMTNFNSRVAYNSIESPELVTITGSYESRLRTFAEEYTKYDDSMDDLIAIDCRTQPAGFYDKLVETRHLRAALTTTVNELDKLLDKYQTNVDSVKRVVEATS